MKMFSSLKLKKKYRSYVDNIDSNFLIPLLKNAKTYCRGTGYFSINSLSTLANGLIPYIQNGGIIKIVTSLELDDKEKEVIKKGQEISEKVLHDKILKIIDEEIITEDILKNLDFVSNLIAVDKLQLKFVYLPKGIYHEKIGILEDFDGELVYFDGSPNETYNGYQENLESITVMRSWDDDESFQTINDEIAYFNLLWSKTHPILKSFDFSEAEKKALFKKYKKTNSYEDFLDSPNTDNDKPQIREYQNEAITEFLNHDNCYFYEMATGTGKTFTAIETIKRLLQIKESLYVMIVVPQIDLQVQWKEELNHNGISCYLFGGEATANWESNFYKSILDYKVGTNKLVVSVCVYDTYFSKINSELQNQKLNNKFLIVDEVHELSPNQIKVLPTSFEYRLGLSATPERHDKQQVKDILSFFTKGVCTTYSYSIDKAIGKYLSRYEYYPIYVSLNDREYEDYQKYSKTIGMLYNENPIDWDKLSDKLTQRSRIIKKAQNKLKKLQEMINDPTNYDFSNSVVYCGQGKDPETEDSIIDEVTEFLADGGYKTHQYTSKTIDRTEILKAFKNDEFDTLVAIKCFDQGVDVPKLDKLFIMASDALNRQTIQRRGRVLRICKDRGKELAYIYDMITLPPDEIKDKNLVIHEFKRLREYMRLSTNKDETIKQVQNYEHYYGIEESDYDREDGEELN